MEEFGHIRSFVRRQGKMTPAQKEAYESLRNAYVIPSDERKILDLDELFPGKPKRIVEIGFGMGRATAIIASENPETAYIGIEVHTPGVGKLLWEIRERKLGNIRILHDDAVPALREMVPAESLDGIHVFFPDPWPKKRHHKRRLLSPEFAGLAAGRLKTGGYMYVVTDWDDYAESILHVLEETKSLKNPHDGFAPAQSWRPLTAFERKGRDAERPIREILFLKR